MPKEATVPWFTIESDTGGKFQWKLWAVGGRKLCEAKGFKDVAECVASISEVKKTAGSPVEMELVGAQLLPAGAE